MLTSSSKRAEQKNTVMSRELGYSMHTCKKIHFTINELVVVNFQAGLQEKLSLIHNKLDWLERLDVTCPHASTENENGDPDTEFDAHDDFKREMAL